MLRRMIPKKQRVSNGGGACSTIMEKQCTSTILTPITRNGNVAKHMSEIDTYHQIFRRFQTPTQIIWMFQMMLSSLGEKTKQVLASYGMSNTNAKGAWETTIKHTLNTNLLGD